MVAGTGGTNPSNISLGNFYAWEPCGQRTIGVIIGMTPYNVTVRHFLEGFAEDYPIMKCHLFNGNGRFTSRDKAYEHYQQLANAFEQEFQSGGLQGAIAARKKHNLYGVIDQLEQGECNWYDTSRVPLAPGTGTYVVEADFLNPSNTQLAQVSSNPRFKEKMIEELLMALPHDETIKMFSENGNSEEEHCGDLQKCTAYEVPRHALDLIGQPYILQVTLK